MASTDGRSADAPSTAARHQRWICIVCGWVYDEDAGLPEHGIAPGTRFEDIPDDWRCPLCGVGKADFALVSDERV